MQLEEDIPLTWCGLKDPSMTLYIFSFACYAQEHFLIEEAPLTNAGPVLHLEWSPLDQELCLMATASGGKVLIWTTALASGPLSIKYWKLVYIRDLTGMLSLICMCTCNLIMIAQRLHYIPGVHVHAPSSQSHCHLRPHAVAVVLAIQKCLRSMQ